MYQWFPSALWQALFSSLSLPLTAIALKLAFYQISAPANKKSGHFSEIQVPAKCSSRSPQISDRICWMPVQLQYVQLMRDKTNGAEKCQVVYLQF